MKQKSRASMQSHKAMGYGVPVGLESFAKGDVEKALDAFRTAFTV
jgi:hydroxypyruvate isomerase